MLRRGEAHAAGTRGEAAPAPGRERPSISGRGSARAGKEDECPDWNTYIGRAFANGYMSDEYLQAVVERNLGRILLVLVLCILVLLGSVRSFLRRSLRRSIPLQSTVFCRSNPDLCEYNRYVKSLMYDFRRSRDVLNNPDGTHTQLPRDYHKLDVCIMPVQVYYADKRLEQYWGHVMGEQQENLISCATGCTISTNRSDADVLVGMFEPPFEGKEWWQRTAAVNLEAHSMHRDSLAATDILVSFHESADVQVNYMYGLSHGVPCTFSRLTSSPATAHPHCLSLAMQKSLQATPEAPAPAVTERLGPRKSNAVLFMSRLCDRHGGFAEKLIAAVNWEIGVDSYGKCFRNSDERRHSRYVGNSAEASKERISSTYRFHIVIENAIVDDYVTEKFYEGLKSASLMVYLGAPNVHRYAPARRSFINVADFSGVDDLASYLIQVHKNETLFDSYFAWRRDSKSRTVTTSSSSALPISASTLKPTKLSPDFEALEEKNFARTDHQSWQCRLCSVYVDRYCSKTPVR